MEANNISKQQVLNSELAQAPVLKLILWNILYVPIWNREVVNSEVAQG